MHVRKRIFTFLFAALAMLLCTACGKWDYSREAMKAANDAQGQTLRVEFKVNQTFTNALRAAAEDNIQPADVDNAMTMDKSIEKLLTSGYRLDVYALRADIDADQAAAQLADEFVNRLAGCEDEGYIGMVKAENGYFYEAVLVYKHDSGSSDGGAGDDGNTGGGIDRIWVSWEKSSGTLHFMKGAGDDDHVGTTLEKVDDEERVKKALIAYGDLEEGDAFAFTDVEHLVIEETSGITTINDAFTNRVSGTSSSSYDENNTLKTATLNGITAIGENAFNNCMTLTTVTLSKNVAVGDAAFESCWSLGYNQSKIDFSKITSIGEKAFAYCKGLTRVDLSNLSDSDNGSNILGKNAFYSCDNLTTVTLPETITYINDSVFNYCDVLSSIDLSHVTYIGEEAFGSCKKLLEVNLKNARTIGFNAFQFCYNLKEINLGKGPKTIYVNAFYASGVDAGRVTIYYGSGSDQELLANLTVLNADGSPLDEPLLSDKKLKEICLASEGDECGNYASGTTGPTAHYEPAAS